MVQLLSMGGLALKRRAKSFGSSAYRRLHEHHSQESSAISLAEFNELNKTTFSTTSILSVIFSALRWDGKIQCSVAD